MFHFNQSLQLVTVPNVLSMSWVVQKILVLKKTTFFPRPFFLIHHSAIVVKDVKLHNVATWLTPFAGMGVGLLSRRTDRRLELKFHYEKGEEYKITNYDMQYVDSWCYSGVLGEVVSIRDIYPPPPILPYPPLQKQILKDFNYQIHFHNIFPKQLPWK